MGCDKTRFKFRTGHHIHDSLIRHLSLDWYELRRIETSMLWDDQEVNQKQCLG